MTNETMKKKIADLLMGNTPKFRSGGQHELMSRKQESQLFNTLHREYNIKRMSISKIDETTRRIVASTWTSEFIIDTTFTVY